MGVVQFFEEPGPFDGRVARYLALGGLGLLAIRQVLDEAAEVGRDLGGRAVRVLRAAMA